MVSCFCLGRFLWPVEGFHEAKPRTIYLDHALDRAAGRELTPAERSARVREIAQFLLDYAIAQAR